MSDVPSNPPPGDEPRSRPGSAPPEQPTAPYRAVEAAPGDERGSAAATAFGTRTSSLPPAPPAAAGRFLALTQAPPPPPSIADPIEEQVTRPHQALDARSAERLLAEATTAPTVPGSVPAPTVDPEADPGDGSEAPEPGTDGPSVDAARASEPPAPPASGPPPAPPSPHRSAGPPPPQRSAEAQAPSPSRRAVAIGVLLGLALGGPALWWVLRGEPTARPPLASPSPAPSRRGGAPGPAPVEPEPSAAPATTADAGSSGRDAGGADAAPGRTGPASPPALPAAAERALAEAREHFAAHRYRQAHAAVLEALAALPEPASPELRAVPLTELGRVLLERGPMAARRAVTVLSEAVSAPGAPTEAWLLYGEALLEAEPPRPDEAAEALRRYLSEAGEEAPRRLRRRAERLLRKAEASARSHGTR